MIRPLARPLALMTVSVCLTASIAASPVSSASPDDQNASTTTKKTAPNPKKPAAKSASEPDKIKTDERMSTRGLKPPPKDADKGKAPKPTTSPDSTNPK